MKKWKYRFKRGLASFLTVGMIAGGVSAATCLPVYAVEGEKAAAAYTDAELNAAVKKIYDGLKEQISDFVNGSGNSTDIAKFVVGIDCKNEELKTAVEGKVPEILSRISKDCSSDLFWYDMTSEKFDNRSYILNIDYKSMKANFKFRFAVKETYRLPKGGLDSVNITEIRETKAALEDPKLQIGEVRKTLYDGLKNEILKLVNGKKDQPTAAFTVSFYDIDTRAKARVLQEEAETIIPEILTSLSKECPSELFWYDQSFNKFDGGSYKYIFNSDYVETAYQSAYFMFTLAVKESYRSSVDIPESIRAQKIFESKSGIDNILGEYNQAKGLSDYEILCGFRDALCTKYPGEPERYTQAFQYFCDRTFGTGTTGGTRCYTVTGKVVKGVEESYHTWNIVRIGGKNYVVDMLNHASGKNGEFFLVGAQLQDGGYEIGNGMKYIPAKVVQDQLPSSSLRYQPEQTDFKFVCAPVEVKAGEVAVVKVEGNKGEVSFKSTNPAVATIEVKPELGNNVALVHLNDVGERWETLTVQIWAIAGATDAYAETTIRHTLWIEPNHNVDVEKPGSNTGGNTGGSGTGVGGIGGGTGGSGSTGNVTTTVSSGPGELLPQIDFCLNSGSATILKSVGADDFTITASGQVKDSAVTYASSDPSVATVDANTGTVHIVGAGTATISATASATTLHREEKCEYSLEVR